jgi:hypothetical protein
MEAKSTQVLLGARSDRMGLALARFVVAPVSVAIAVRALVGCGADAESGSGGSSTTATVAAAPSPEAAANAVCATLRSITNTMIDHANAAAREVAATTDAATRSRALDDGFARLISELDPLEAAVSSIAVPPGDDWARLRSGLLEAPAAARAELVEERAALAAVGPIRDEDERGRVGQFFNSLEKVSSLIEPSIRSDADPQLRAAFLAEPECRFVASVGRAPS